MAELVLRLRERELSRFPIVHTRVTLGRDQESDVVIDNVSVSRTHAVLIYVDNHFRVRDNSANGLTVNGNAVKDAVLNYGDVIGIGKFEVVLQKSAEEQPPTTPKPAKPSKTSDAGLETLRPARMTKPEPVPAVSTEQLAAEAVAAIAAPPKALIDWSTILKIAGVGLFLIVAALAGAIWALENKIIDISI
jgi:pSer/pThr/pTyr-binding forkhead associated (FHA) protein